MKVRAVIVMGVSGSGKTTLGTALATRLGWAFADADDFHPATNREKMARGLPLTDEDRWPWLETLRALLAEHLSAGRPVVLACSALKQRYRDTLTAGLEGTTFVFAQGSAALIAERMRRRQHFMPLSLLASQFAALEAPEDALTVDIRWPVEHNVRLIADALGAPDAGDGERCP